MEEEIGSEAHRETGSTKRQDPSLTHASPLFRTQAKEPSSRILRRKVAMQIMTRSVVIACLLPLLGVLSFAATISKTGTFGTPEDTETLTLTLTSTGDVTLQTYGFGGGTNAAGTLISAGGFDPFVGLFSGTGSSATLINGTSDVLSNYTSGCPPAGTVTVGGLKNQCGDVTLQFNGLPGGDLHGASDGRRIHPQRSIRNTCRPVGRWIHRFNGRGVSDLRRRQ